MSELTPGATAILDAPPVTDPAVAVQRIEQLKVDEAFQQRVQAGDPEAYAEHTRLWRVAHGLPAEPQMPVNTQDVLTQHSSRAVAEAEQRMELYQTKGFSAEAAYEIVNQRPIPFQERQHHERQLSRLKNDQAFMDRLRRQDSAARLEYDSHVVALSLPVGTLEDINRWQLAHKRPLSK
jgi:hypothetical protein